MKITVAGTGYVGLVAGVCFAEKGHNVICVDIDEKKINKMKSGKSPIYEENLEELMVKNYNEGRLDYTTDYKNAYKNSDAIFIGVGTPQQEDGNANLTYVENVAKQIAESIEKDCLIVIKSTVPVGTNDKIEKIIKDSLVHNVNVEIASNPEFLSQGHAIRDTLQAKRIVIGTESKKAEQQLMEIYKSFNLPIVSVNRRSAEMIKYASNNFLALKISYINDIANLCELVGADIEDVAIGMSYDPRIGKDFLQAGIGYGGSCLPKDTKALKNIGIKNGYSLKTVEAVMEINENQKLKLYNKALKKIKSFDRLKVAVLGVTFKPGTDDLRESPAIENINLLLKGGANVHIYDPIGIENARKIYRNKISYTVNYKESLKNADVCFIFTEWNEIKNIKPEEFKKFMAIPLVYDGRNIYDLDKMSKAGVEYYSIGR